MRLQHVSTPLTEMAAKKICPICGNPMAGFHFWYKGGWKCKKSSLQGTASPAGATASVGAPNATPPSLQPTRPPAPAKNTLESWLQRHNITKYTLNPDGSLDVNQSVDLSEFSGVRLPVKFNKVGGDFNCAGGLLTTLENCPNHVDGDFYANHNELVSLAGFPTYVGGTVNISNNGKLSSLDGIQDLIVGDSFYADSLKSMSTLTGIHKRIKKIGGQVTFRGGNIKEGALGLMMIRGVNHVNTDVQKVDAILNTHLKGDRDPIATQEELIDGGFKAFARP